MWLSTHISRLTACPREGSKETIREGVLCKNRITEHMEVTICRPNCLCLLRGSVNPERAEDLFPRPPGVPSTSPRLLKNSRGMLSLTDRYLPERRLRALVQAFVLSRPTFSPVTQVEAWMTYLPKFQVAPKNWDSQSTG